MNIKTKTCGTVVALTVSVIAHTASAEETRGYVVSWFYPAVAAQVTEVDCPKGPTPDAATNVIRMLEEQGKEPSEIEKIMADYPNSVYAHIARRGRVDGKPANPYTNPTSVPDPNINTVEGEFAYGFNLDGVISDDDFTDPETGETGVDSQLFRAFGCMGVMRADPGTRPTWPSIQWNTIQQQMPAWLVQVSGIDDLKNDSEVLVRLLGAAGVGHPIDVNVQGVHVDADPDALALHEGLFLLVLDLDDQAVGGRYDRIGRIGDQTLRVAEEVQRETREHQENERRETPAHQGAPQAQERSDTDEGPAFDGHGHEVVAPQGLAVRFHDVPSVSQRVRAKFVILRERSDRRIGSCKRHRILRLGSSSLAQDDCVSSSPYRRFSPRRSIPSCRVDERRPARSHAPHPAS